MSPIGIKGATIVVDATVMEMYNAAAGANQVDKHYKNINPKRDFKDEMCIRDSSEGDTQYVISEECVECGACAAVCPVGAISAP